jgi:hypothetical protein
VSRADKRLTATASQCLYLGQMDERLLRLTKAVMPQFTRAIPEITVFLSSPSDVAAERQIVKRAIQEINADPAWQSRCVLKPLAYEDCVPSQMGKSAQRIVDDFVRMSSQADIVVCIFCSRMGTPTVDEKTGRQYLSGTHYEFDSAYQAFKGGGEVAPRILLFLGSRDLPAGASDDEHDQYTEARRFKKQIRACTDYDGLYFEYRELSQLESLVRIHLKQHLDQLLAVTLRSSGLLVQHGQLFVSYAWGEDSTESDRQRGEIVDHLCARLKDWGWDVQRDVERMRTGDNIATFMRQIATADRVLVILSEKYLRSRYCVNELFGVYRWSDYDEADFVKRVVPVVLADARFDDPLARAEYAEYWANYIGKLEPKESVLGPKDRELLRRMREWRYRIGEMLEILADRIIPYGFDDICRDDFRGVRQLLEGYW